MAKIRKLGEKWVCDYVDHLGKRHRLKFDYKREAEDFRNDAVLRLQGMKGRKELVKVSDAIRRYHEICSHNKASDEKLYFQRMYDVFFEIELLYLHEVELIHLEQLQKKLRETLSPATVNRHFNTYKNFFNKCVDWGWLEYSPAGRLKSIPSQSKLRRCWSRDEIEIVINSISQWCGDYLYFLASTGVRPGKETLRLTWDDVNFNDNTIHVWNQKGDGSVRERLIPMTEKLSEFFKAKWERARIAFRGKPKDLVFLDDQWQSPRCGRIDRLLRRTCERLDLPSLTPYGLRHTVLTMMTKNKTNLEQVRKLAGHANIRTTQDYLHLDVEDVRAPLEQANLVENLKRFGTNGHSKEKGNHRSD